VAHIVPNNDVLPRFSMPALWLWRDASHGILGGLLKLFHHLIVAQTLQEYQYISAVFTS
jgi:hypothetical protein